MRTLTILLTISILGTLFLLILSQIQEPKLSSINQLTIKQLDKWVKVQGQVTKQYDRDTFYTLKLKDKTSEIEIVVFQANQNFQNKTIEIIGKLSEYNNKLQITANKIKTIN